MAGQQAVDTMEMAILLTQLVYTRYAKSIIRLLQNKEKTKEAVKVKV